MSLSPGLEATPPHRHQRGNAAVGCKGSFLSGFRPKRGCVDFMLKLTLKVCSSKSVYCVLVHRRDILVFTLCEPRLARHFVTVSVEEDLNNTPYIHR